MCSYNWCTAFFKIMFRVGCSGVERLVLSPYPLVKVWGQSISVCVWCGLWCTSCTESPVRSILSFHPFHPLLSLPCSQSGLRAPSQPSSLWMLFWSLFNVDVEQFVCPLLRKNSLFQKQSCGYEVAYLS